VTFNRNRSTIRRRSPPVLAKESYGENALPAERQKGIYLPIRTRSDLIKHLISRTAIAIAVVARLCAIAGQQVRRGFGGLLPVRDPIPASDQNLVCWLHRPD